MLLKYLRGCLNSILILVLLCLLYSTISMVFTKYSFICFREFSLFPLYPCLFVLKFCALYFGSYVSCALNLYKKIPC